MRRWNLKKHGADERSLVASGQMTLPKKPFREDRFWAIGARLKVGNLKRAIQKAIDAERDDNRWPLRVLP